MNEVDLKKRAEELEQSLNLQLQTLKKDSQVWLVGGGAALLAGILTFSLIKKGRKKKNKRKAGYEVEHAGETVKRGKKRRFSRKSSFFPSLKKRLFLTLLSYGQAKLMAELNKRKKRVA